MAPSETLRSGKMPVGCLGQSGPKGLDVADSNLYLHNGLNGSTGETNGTESDASRQAEEIALMQQTLLLQIFRVEKDERQGAVSPRTFLSCTTCSPYAPNCCQVESGWSLLANFVKVNSKAVWNTPLVKAVNSLCFQVV